MTTMKPSDRAALIARAKRAAVPVVNLVGVSIPPARVLGRLTEAEKDALIIILAEAADHTRLRVIVATDDDGRPEPIAPVDAGDLPRRLRQAHTEASRLRRAGEKVPDAVRKLDNAYHDALKAKRETVIAPDPNAERNRMALAEALRERQAS